ncbi:hypothetical protein SAMN05518672_11585 [Chitinophaga sp. CF118]|uniref:contact-dependent growth inhibition system immunity protein n=1 Tax=Chitinophaga sp. CF118 TaxID=1884367 RepID=UPI0008EC685F|nr:contact-dependent growth inhibition system immunity protein [Chitinophaga sp. CF118]SFF07619.1 hypothetical protein SAMN05518672_11585 [Chitinophaga sp. CF118]
MENLDKTLEELGLLFPGGPKEGSSYLVETVNKLRKKKLKDYTVEDLRLMIGQNIGINILMPIAIYKLKENPFLEGDFYPGDLLVSVLESSCNFCKDNPSYGGMLNQIVGFTKIQVKNREDLTDNIKKRILDLVKEYECCMP